MPVADLSDNGHSSCSRPELLVLLSDDSRAAVAAQTLSDPPPDLILLDWSGPAERGYQAWGYDALLELKRSPRFENVPVVVALACDKLNCAAEAYALGASCVIPRPPDWGAFLARCDRFLNRVSSLAASAAPR